MDHLAQPARDMQSRIEALKNKLPRGVIVVGDGLLFKHSLFRGLLFQPLVAFLFGLIGVSGVWLKTVKWMDPSFSSHMTWLLAIVLTLLWLWRVERWWCGLTTQKSIYIDHEKLIIYGAFGRIRYQGGHDGAYRKFDHIRNIVGVSLITERKGTTLIGGLLGLGRHNICTTASQNAFIELTGWQWYSRYKLGRSDS